MSSTDGRTDGQGESSIPPPTSLGGGMKICNQIWPWKSKVKVVGEVKVQSKNICQTSYRLTSFWFHVNPPGYTQLHIYESTHLHIYVQLYKDIYPYTTVHTWSISHKFRILVRLNVSCCATSSVLSGLVRPIHPCSEGCLELAKCTWAHTRSHVVKHDVIRKSTPTAINYCTYIWDTHVYNIYIFLYMNDKCVHFRKIVKILYLRIHWILIISSHDMDSVIWGYKYIWSISNSAWNV